MEAARNELRLERDSVRWVSMQLRRRWSIREAQLLAAEVIWTRYASAMLGWDRPMLAAVSEYLQSIHGRERTAARLLREASAQYLSSAEGVQAHTGTGDGIAWWGGSASVSFYVGWCEQSKQFKVYRNGKAVRHSRNKGWMFVPDCVKRMSFMVLLRGDVLSEFLSRGWSLSRFNVLSHPNSTRRFTLKTRWSHSSLRLTPLELNPKPLILYGRIDFTSIKAGERLRADRCKFIEDVRQLATV